jgi:hypothetical protein
VLPSLARLRAADLDIRVKAQRIEASGCLFLVDAMGLELPEFAPVEKSPGWYKRRHLRAGDHDRRPHLPL